jgi:hypothetical protein
MIGKLLDRNFHRLARLLGITITEGQQNDIRNFPIERARLEVVTPIVVFACLMMVAGAVAVIGPLLNKIGTGWVSVLVAGILVVFSPFL